MWRAAAEEAVVPAMHRSNLLTTTVSLSQPDPPDGRRRWTLSSHASLLQPAPSSSSSSSLPHKIKRLFHSVCIVMKASAAKDTHL